MPPRSLRLFALPLARPVTIAQGASKTAASSPLVYLHAKKQSDISNGEISYLSRATNKAADFWAGLGAANEGTWKRKAFVQGERFMDRIEYEEWALKAIDPALGPTPFHTSSSSSSDDTPTTPPKEPTPNSTAISNTPSSPSPSGGIGGRVSVLYPESLLKPEGLIETLKTQLEHREPHHKAAFYKCLFGAPLTFPFAIVPIVPNFPLFYVLWRAWSHYRAWKASSYLSSLLSSSQIHFTPSKDLDAVYKPLEGHVVGEGELLLTQDKVPKLAKAFGLTEEECAELRRAVQQAGERLKIETDKQVMEGETKKTE